MKSHIFISILMLVIISSVSIVVDDLTGGFLARFAALAFMVFILSEHWESMPWK